MAESYVNDVLHGRDKLPFGDSILGKMFTTEAELADIAGLKDTHRLTPSYMAARRLFSASLMQSVVEVRRSGGEDRVRQLIGAIYEDFLSMHPSINSYTGDTAEQAQLAAVALKSPELQRSFYRNIVNDLMYDLSFGYEAQNIQSMFDGIDAVQKLNVLHVARDIARMAPEQGEWAEPAAKKTVAAFEDESWRASQPPIVRIAAHEVAQEIRSNLESEFVDVDSLSAEEYISYGIDKLIEEGKKREEEADRQQRELATEYPELNSNERLVKIASDAAGEILHDTIHRISRHSPGGKTVETTSLSDVVSQNQINLSESDARLLQELHRPYIKRIVEEDLNISLNEIPLSSQVRLLSFMANGDTARYKRLSKMMQGYDKKERMGLAETFLATEFGQDFGDSILSISEAQPEKAPEVFRIVNSLRDRARQFARWFEMYDFEFAKATERAMNERITDSIAALEKLATEGVLDVRLGVGGDFSIESIEEAEDILRQLDVTMGTIHNVVTSEDVRTTQVNADTKQFAMYRFASEKYGQALLYVRPEGARGYDPEFEYGNRQGVEASISFIANPLNPHELLTEKHSEGVSIRFDREGRKKDESPFSEDRDPTRKDGSISLDISSILGKEDTPAVRIGKLVAAGNTIRAARHGGFESLHHNTNHFDQERYGSAEGFSKLAVYIMHLAEAQVAMQRQGKHRSRFGELAVVGGPKGARSGA